MCIICVQFAQEKLTVEEGLRNLGEIKETLGDHAEEVEDMLYTRMVTPFSINGVSQTLVGKPEISYEDLVRIARMTRQPTIVWSKRGADRGILYPGGTITVTPDTAFDICHTDCA